MNLNQFDETEHRLVSGKDAMAALKGLLLSPQGKPWSKNQE